MKFALSKQTCDFDEFRVRKNPWSGWEIQLISNKEVVKEIRPETVGWMRTCVEDILRAAENNLVIEV